MAVINVHGTALARGWGRREGGREGEARKRENQAEKAGERGLTQMENEEGKRMRRVEKKKEKERKKSMGIGYRRQRLVTLDILTTKTKATLPSPNVTQRPVAKARQDS